MDDHVGEYRKRDTARRAGVYITVLAVLFALMPGALTSAAQAYTPPE